MQGNMVSAARWLGLSIVLSSCILVLGLRWPLPPYVQPAAPTQPANPPVAEEATQSEPISEAEARMLLEQICVWLRPCFTNEYSSSAYAENRVSELLNNSEDLRRIEEEWEAIWFVDGAELLHAPRSE